MPLITLNLKEKIALKCIRNQFIHNATTPSIRELMTKLGYKSPISAKLVVDQLINKGFLKREAGKLQLNDLVVSNTPDRSLTRDIPLVGTVSCGGPLLAEENIEMTIPVSTSLAEPGSRYFLLRTTGDSLNKEGIDEGDVILVRQQSTAENGDIVVALIDNEATIKKFFKSDGAVILKPSSTNPDNQPIILNNNFIIQGKYIKTFKDL